MRAAGGMLSLDRAEAIERGEPLNLTERVP